MKNIITVIVSVCVLSFAQVERWVYQFDGGVNGNDEAKAIIQGTDGNIYATGYGHIMGNGSDVVVVSLTPAGGERWVYTYNGPGDSMDVALGVACDQDGNLYIAGSSYNNNNDLLIVSLTSDGVERWVYQYNGTGNGDDIANSIAVGLDGNVYAAGVSYGTGTGDDFVIVSVDTAGNERWVYRYDWASWHDGANVLTCGADDNIYVGGYSYMWVCTQVFTVICVDTVGSEKWIFRTQGTGVVDEAVQSIVYGLDGNIYAAGYSSLLDFTVVSLDTAGTRRWEYVKGQAGFNDRALDVAYGSDGNIYSVGFLESNGTGYDFTVISLSNASDSNWIYQYNGSGSGNDVAHAIVYGEDAHIYAAGSNLDSITGDDFTVIRLDTTGAEKWVYRFSGSGDGSDIAFSITYGLDHNLYIAGYSYDSTTALDFTVISLDTTTSHIEEDKATPTKSNNFASIIFSGPILLPEGKNYKVFDITGRVVTPDKIKPGIYFIEIDGVITKKVVKVK
ncbi:MAG: hypothetical protein WBB67_04750 [bacterium]